MSTLKAFWTTTLMAAVLLVGAAVNTPASAEDFPIVGKKAPDFNLETHVGKKEALSNHKGKVVIVNFGSKDSEKEAIALFNSMSKRYVNNPDVQILSMIVLKNLPFYANKQTVLTRVEEIAENSGYPHIPRLLDWEGKSSEKFGVDLGPNLLVVGRDGTVTYMQGPLAKGTSRALADAVKEALEKK